MPLSIPEYRWIYHPTFQEFTPHHLYAVLQLRQNVFIIEQDCIYPDIDDIDQQSAHLLLMYGDQLAGYLRIVPEGVKFGETSLGRIIIHPAHRRNALGRELVQEGIRRVAAYQKKPIRIEAQCYLKEFYESFGFRMASHPYDVDGIDHIQMVRPAQN
ncbi:MAG: GNAT family N-acetyltransferase [Balneolaceae bacterium]